MNKLVQINKEDIILDPEGIGEMLTGCLKRKKACVLAGSCEVFSTLIVSFEPSGSRCKGRIIIAPIDGEGAEEVCGSIARRYADGFSLRSSFHVNDSLWGIFLQE